MTSTNFLPMQSESQKVGAPLITAVSNRKILFLPNAAFTIQEWLQVEKNIYFEEVEQNIWGAKKNISNGLNK